VNVVTNKEGVLVATNRNGELVIVDEIGREKETYPVALGAEVKVKDGQEVKAGVELISWDPYSIPILSEADGVAKFGDVMEGITMHEDVDKVSGMVQKVITESKDEKRLPRISIKDKDNKTIGRYPLPVGTYIMVREGDHVSVGDVIAKTPRDTAKTKDITGGLPKVVQLFEARKPKDKAVISEIDGVVEIGSMVRGKRKIIVRGDTETRDYLVPKGAPIIVRTGDRVRAGNPLVDGPVDPHDILETLGVHALQKYLVDEVQKVYRLQGVEINDKHIEIIVRQMLGKVRIEDPGETRYLPGDEVNRTEFDEENRKAEAEGRLPAKAKPMLLGIAKAALNRESFISAASFQETTKVLTDACISSKVDYLFGLKENVIMGRLVPVGTGMKKYRDTEVVVEKVENAEPLEEPEPIPVEPEESAEAENSSAGS